MGEQSLCFPCLLLCFLSRTNASQYLIYFSPFYFFSFFPPIFIFFASLSFLISCWLMCTSIQSTGPSEQGRGAITPSDLDRYVKQFLFKLRGQIRPYQRYCSIFGPNTFLPTLIDLPAALIIAGINESQGNFLAPRFHEKSHGAC